MGRERSSWITTVGLFVVLFTAFSCKKDDTSGVPAYIKIDSIRVETDALTEGSTSSNITDAWFYANDDLIGVFEMPTEIPVLKSGNAKLTTFGGIQIAGISSLRRLYPFYQAHRIDTILVEKETITIQPVLRYKDNLSWLWIEGFDDLTITMDTVSGSQVPLLRTTSPDSVKEGRASMRAYMDGENKYFLCQSTKDPWFLPVNGADIYLEFDYKTDSRVVVILQSYNSSGGSFFTNLVTLKPKLNDLGEPIWNKTYILLSPFIVNQADPVEHRILFESYLTSSQNSGYLLMDNIKLLY